MKFQVDRKRGSRITPNGCSRKPKNFKNISSSPVRFLLEPQVFRAIDVRFARAGVNLTTRDALFASYHVPELDEVRVQVSSFE